METMGCRNEELQRTVNGFTDTGIPLIAKDPNLDAINGILYRDAGFADDSGIYYFVPWIIRTFGLSVESGVNALVTGLVVIGLIIGICSFFYIFKNWYSRFFAILAQIFFDNFMHQFQDVYIAGHFAVSAIIPLFILLYHKLPKFNLFLIACLGLSGIIIGYCNFIRIYSGGGAFLFVLLWIFLNRNLLKLQKVACALILLFFTFLPYLHFDLLKTNRDRFLNQQFAYKEITSKHPTWHSVYLGLTYLSNKHVEANDDIIADKAAKIVNPNVVYCSDEYDQILKNQVFSIIKKDPLFILKTVAVKAIVLCVMVSIYANFGLLYSFFVKRSIIDLLPFLGAACFYALPGILVFPSRRYVLGMVSISIVFGIYMIGLGLEKYCKSSYKNFVTKHSRA